MCVTSETGGEFTASDNLCQIWALSQETSCFGHILNLPNICVSKCIKDVFLNCALTGLLLRFFCILFRPPRGATFLKNARTKTSHGQQLPVLLGEGKCQWRADAGHRSQLSIHFSLPSHHPLFSACSAKKKGNSPLLLRHPQTAF